MIAAGQEFRYGPDGFTALGSPTPIPGLPDDAGKALSQLGITITTPKPVITADPADKDKVQVNSQGMVIDFDMVQLKSQLRPLLDVLDTVVGALPNELGPLKENIQVLLNLAPRIVVILGQTETRVDTSQGIVLPPWTATRSTGPTPRAPDDGHHRHRHRQRHHRTAVHHAAERQRPDRHLHRHRPDHRPGRRTPAARPARAVLHPHPARPRSGSPGQRPRLVCPTTRTRRPRWSRLLPPRPRLRPARPPKGAMT